MGGVNGMLKINLNNQKETLAEPGSNLSRILKDAGVLMDFPCGGTGTCGQCKVKVAFVPGWHDKDMKEVLACTFIVNHDLWVQVPDQPDDLGTVILTTGGNEGQYAINSGIDSDSTKDCWGLAVDIGTTTVVGYLVNLLTGQEVAVGAELNRQRIYGADVISRIAAAQSSRDNLKQLQDLVLATINSIIDTVSKQAAIVPEQICLVTLAGNTCMHHLLLGLDPKSLGKAPFLPVIQKEVVTTAGELGIMVNPEAVAWVFPVIAGFVGGDTVGAVLATNLHRRQGVTLLVDIGTNGELVLNAFGQMAACSAAAGPALEGAEISCGMRAETGAISRVRLLPDIKVDVIGQVPPKGICGSGLVDLLGELVMARAVSFKGGLVKPERYDGPKHLHERIIPGEQGYKFVLVRAEENDGLEISLTQNDLLQLQLAKGALNAAMEMLVKEAGIEGEQVDAILLAGAFGNFMDKEKALQIGLFPEWARGKIINVGNAAGEGAKAALLSLDKRAEAIQSSQGIKFLELAGTAEFQDAFINGLLFHKAK